MSFLSSIQGLAGNIGQDFSNFGTGIQNDVVHPIENDLTNIGNRVGPVVNQAVQQVQSLPQQFQAIPQAWQLYAPHLSMPPAIPQAINQGFQTFSRLPVTSLMPGMPQIPNVPTFSNVGQLFPTTSPARALLTGQPQNFIPNLKSTLSTMGNNMFPTQAETMAMVNHVPGAQQAYNNKQMNLAMSFSGGGFGNAGSSLTRDAIQGLKAEGQKIVDSLPGITRLAHLNNYSTELLNRGFTKPQVDMISSPEAAAILKNGITPLQRFGNSAILRGAKPIVNNPSSSEDPFIAGLVKDQARQGLNNDLRNSVDLAKANSSDIARATRQATVNIPQNIADAIDSAGVKNKVNILDYIRTPENVFKKIGLQNEAKNLRSAYDGYVVQLPKELQKITDWAKSVPKDSNESIFNYLDGKQVTLTSKEKQVAGEIKTYLAGWADKLGLPKEARISNYITHLFPRGSAEKELDPELAKLIQSRVAASVHDPFLEKRLGKQDYSRDTWSALQAYTKRAVRKVNLDPALKAISDKADSLPLESFNYVNTKISQINMQPAQIDNLIDNLIKSSPVGYKFGARPTNVLTARARQLVFRGLIGLNPGSAIKNLQQGTNTYATLGEKSFGVGLIKAVQHLPEFLAGKTTDLERNGIIAQGEVTDKVQNAVYKFWQHTDSGLFALYNQVEKFNRATAYYGGLDKAARQGLSGQAAIDFAKGIVRKTQFSYDNIDTPVALGSDLAKTLAQFSTYPVKETEYLAGMLKNKDIGGSIRWLASNLLWMATVGKFLGQGYSAIIPSFRFGVPPTMQAAQGAYQVATGAPDAHGNPASPDILKRIEQNKNLLPGLANLIPAGGQIRKTVGGLHDVSQGYVASPNGNVKYPLSQTPSEYVRAGLFGTSALPETQAYYNSGSPKPPAGLSTKQTLAAQQSGNVSQTYQGIMAKRAEATAVAAAKTALKTSGGQNTTVGSTYLYVNPKTGAIDSIDTSFQPVAPTLTGQAALDKQLMAKYNGQLTTKANDITTLYRQGQLSAAQANSQLTALKGQHLATLAKTAGAPRAKKITISSSTRIKAIKPIKLAMIKAPKAKAPSFKMPKTPTFKLTKIKAPKIAQYRPTSYKYDLKTKSLKGLGSRLFV